MWVDSFDSEFDAVPMCQVQSLYRFTPLADEHSWTNTVHMMTIWLSIRDLGLIAYNCSEIMQFQLVHLFGSYSNLTKL